MTINKTILDKINQTSPSGLSVFIDFICLTIISVGILFGGTILQALQ